ncbi:MAG TPA: hypothetical protein VNN21_04950 [Dehalococcoidia bacterium]|nr:hypothetical protein [Dehalococcoidia bacterium]
MPDAPSPLDSLVSFPAGRVLARKDHFHAGGRVWAVDYELSLPRPLVQSMLRSQLELAGFVLESDPVNRGIVRLFRADAYVWGVLEAARGKTLLSLVYASLSPAREAGGEPGR